MGNNQCNSLAAFENFCDYRVCTKNRVALDRKRTLLELKDNTHYQGRPVSHVLVSTVDAKTSKMLQSVVSVCKRLVQFQVCPFLREVYYFGTCNKSTLLMTQWLNNVKNLGAKHFTLEMVFQIHFTIHVVRYWNRYEVVFELQNMKVIELPAETTFVVAVESKLYEYRSQYKLLIDDYEQLVARPKATWRRDLLAFNVPGLVSPMLERDPKVWVNAFVKAGVLRPVPFREQYNLLLNPDVVVYGIPTEYYGLWSSTYLFTPTVRRVVEPHKLHAETVQLYDEVEALKQELRNHNVL